MQQENTSRIVQAHQSLVFIPFNKLYSSPIMDINKNNEIVLCRKFKTAELSKSQGKIVNGMKFKFRQPLLLEENNLYKIFKNRTEKENFLIGIAGGSNSLKKKIHIGFIAHAYNELLELINQETDRHLLQISLEHQEAASGATPLLQNYNSVLTGS